MSDENKKSSSPVPLAILFLAAVGVPSAVAVTTGVIEHLWPALGWALLSEVFVLGVGFATDIGQGLRKRWVERAIEKADTSLQKRFSTFRRTYLQHLIYRHRNFDVKGLTTQGPHNLELERVFVDLSMVPQPAHEASANPISLPKKLRGRQSIWDYTKFLLPGGQNLVVIGAPGSGKTTLLKHMALQLAVGKRYRSQDNVPDLMPILLFLRDHAESITTKPDLSLVQAVQDSLTKFQGPTAPPGWMQTQLDRGRCLVMLDGLMRSRMPRLGRRSSPGWKGRWSRTQRISSWSRPVRSAT